MEQIKGGVNSFKSILSEFPFYISKNNELT